MIEQDKNHNYVICLVEVAFLAAAMLIFLPFVWRFSGRNRSGWICLELFCATQIAADILLYINLRNEVDSTKSENLLMIAAIVAFVSVSPLLLGIRFFADAVAIDNNGQCIFSAYEPFGMALLVLVGLVLTIVGYLQAMRVHMYETGHTLTLIAAVFFLVAGVFISIFVSSRVKSFPLGDYILPQKLLLSASLLVLPFLLVRLVYFIISAQYMGMNSFSNYVTYTINALFWGDTGLDIWL